MFLDHHALSTFRQCAQHFQYLHVEGRRPKTGVADRWFLDFGSVFHKVVEDLYNWKQEGTFSIERLTEHTAYLWKVVYNIDRYATNKNYIAINGLVGFLALVHQYVQYYTQDTERLRLIGTEIAFGRQREVPLGCFTVITSESNGFDMVKVSCYLTGRIDFLMDSGHRIGPLDHKTRGFFKGDLGAAYNPQEGMTGYIYATREILKKNFPDLAKTKRVDTAWMNFVQVQSEPDPIKRFRRVPVMRSDYELEQFRLRQLTSFEKIFRQLYFNQIPDWDTEKCTRWYYSSECIYRKVDRQPDAQSQLIVLNQDFDVDKFWNPEKTPEENVDELSVSGNN